MDRRVWVDEKRRQIASLGDLAVGRIIPSRRDFLQFTATQKRGVALIVRVKRADPYTGGTWPQVDLAALARTADDADVGAVAVCTAQFFAARAGDLESCAAAVTAPVLSDDLCLDVRQLFDARLRGADAVVVPAGELSAGTVSELVEVAASLHMAGVIEARNEEELAVALSCPHAAIGLNRVTDRGFVCVDETRRLADAIPAQRVTIVLAEPRDLEDVVSLRGVIDAAVFGDLILDAVDAAATMAEFSDRLR